MIRRLFLICFSLAVILILAIFLGLAVGSSDSGLTKTYHALFYPDQEPTLSMIIWKIRFPRVLMAMVAGAVLSVGGVVFQSILRNPLAEPYILGISGGSAIGAILGILLGLSQFPGVSLTAFTGSILTLLLILGLSSGQTVLGKDRLLLSGVMVNAFCGAVIMFLVSMTHDSRLHNIIFWLMGDLSSVSASQVGILLGIEIPSFILIFIRSPGQQKTTLTQSEVFKRLRRFIHSTTTQKSKVSSNFLTAKLFVLTKSDRHPKQIQT